MKGFYLFGILGIFIVSCYDRHAAVGYAQAHWNQINHQCGGGYLKCSPYSYFGNEACGYSGQGGDCANFVSQCVLAGGHGSLKRRDAPAKDFCRGYPCGVEEVGATKLGICLSRYHGWERTCGYLQPPPSNIKFGDVLIYHASSCDNYSAHATLIVEDGPEPKIACHSSNQYGTKYTYMKGTKPYFEWLHYPG